MDKRFHEIADDLRAIMDGAYLSAENTPSGRIAEIRRFAGEPDRIDQERWALQDACKIVERIIGYSRKPTAKVRQEAMQAISAVRRAPSYRNTA